MATSEIIGPEVVAPAREPAVAPLSFRVGVVSALDVLASLRLTVALFALSIGDVPADLTGLGLAAADAVAAAIVSGVRAASSLPGLPAARDLR